MQKITPFLMFNDNVEEAMNFYLSIFKNSKMLSSNTSDGKVNSASFELEGQQFRAYNGGSYFTFTEGISLFVDCKNQEEVDELWEKLSEGGSKSQCGWLKDKFGISWQIIPSILMEYMNDEDEEKSERVFQAMMKMSKIDIAEIQKAYDGK